MYKTKQKSTNEITIVVSVTKKYKLVFIYFIKHFFLQLFLVKLLN